LTPTAIVEAQINLPPEQAAAIVNTASGTIDGLIYLGHGNDTLTNAGHTSGTIDMDRKMISSRIRESLPAVRFFLGVETIPSRWPATLNGQIDCGAGATPFM